MCNRTYLGMLSFVLDLLDVISKTIGCQRTLLQEVKVFLWLLLYKQQ